MIRSENTILRTLRAEGTVKRGAFGSIFLYPKGGTVKDRKRVDPNSVRSLVRKGLVQFKKGESTCLDDGWILTEEGAKK
jgi:hypothetical protein